MFSSATASCMLANQLGLLLTRHLFVAVQKFVDAAILAYECGMNEDSLRHELKVYKQSLEQQMAPPGMVSRVLNCCVINCLRVAAHDRHVRALFFQHFVFWGICSSTEALAWHKAQLICSHHRQQHPCH